MYNQKELISMLKKLQGNKSLNNFAKDIDVDSSTLSRIINYNRTTPPSPEILKKMANSSKGVTSYIELMYICGYITEENIDELEKLLIKLKELKNIKDTNNILLENMKSKLTDKEKEIAVFYTTDTLNKLSKYKNITYEFLAQQVLDKLKKTKGIDVERTYGYYILNVANKLDSINYNISSNNESNNKMLNIDVSMFDEKDIEDIKKYIEFLRSKK